MDSAGTIANWLSGRSRPSSPARRAGRRQRLPELDHVFGPLRVRHRQRPAACASEPSRPRRCNHSRAWSSRACRTASSNLDIGIGLFHRRCLAERWGHTRRRGTPVHRRPSRPPDKAVLPHRPGHKHEPVDPAPVWRMPARSAAAPAPSRYPMTSALPNFR